MTDPDGTFSSVIVHDIQDDFNASLMELLHHLLELLGSSCWPSTIWSKSAHRGEEVDVGVAPDVDHVVSGVGAALELQLIILKDWKQLHCIDAKLHKVRNLQNGDL